MSRLNYFFNSYLMCFVRCKTQSICTLLNVPSFFKWLNLESAKKKKNFGTSCNIFPTAFLSVSLHLASAAPVRLSLFFPTINWLLINHEFGLSIILREISWSCFQIFSAYFRYYVNLGGKIAFLLTWRQSHGKSNSGSLKHEVDSELQLL